MLGCGGVLCETEYGETTIAVLCAHLDNSKYLSPFVFSLPCFLSLANDALTLDDGVPYQKFKLRKPKEAEGHVRS